MTRRKTIDLTCPNCDRHFTSEVVELVRTGGRKRTDFHLAIDGVQALLHGVHLCAQCGFAGPESWFADRGGVSDEVRHHVWDELTPKLSGATPPASEKYEFAAKVATWDGAMPREVGDIWLRAAWCCVDEGDIEAERFYRRHAAWSFEEALETYDGVDPKERAVLTYLVGELWRRIGDTQRATTWLAAVESEVIAGREQAWIVRLAKQQQEDPCEWLS
ncbi:MAG TPA: DUF2225 domain-containing protein [Gemmatimonadaceae bacterium]